MKFTYYTIIGKNFELLEGHIKNIREYAGFDKLPCEKEIVLIIYTNPSIPKLKTEMFMNYCREQNIRYILYEEKTNSFIDNLYACWNLGYQEATDGYVFRSGSDQVFSKDSFIHLYEQAEKLRLSGKDKFILQANTIENIVALNQIGAVSRHFACDFGGTFGSFDFSSFESFIEQINKNAKNEIISIEEALILWGKPTMLMTSLGTINRVDGCSWLMTRDDWKNYGPLPVIENNITGDVIIHDKLQLNGYTEYIVRDCITYHFVRGESMNQY